MDKFLNDNWETVSMDLNPAFREVVRSLISHILINVFKKVPFKELYLH